MNVEHNDVCNQYHFLRWQNLMLKLKYEINDVK